MTMLVDDEMINLLKDICHKTHFCFNWYPKAATVAQVMISMMWGRLKDPDDDDDD